MIVNKIAARNALLGAILGMVAVTGCSKKEPANVAAPAPQVTPGTPTPAPAPPPAIPAPAAPAVATQPPPAGATADTAADTAPLPNPRPASGPAIGRSIQQPILRAVRTGLQPNADRVVFEFNNTKLPAWQIEYVDRPVRDCGSGDAVPVAGEAWLQVRFTGAQAHTEKGASSGGPRRRALAQPIARELVRTCDFEGEVTWVVGVVRPNGYTANTMTSPYRLVIDIAH